MRLTQLWLTDFRNYDTAELALPAGLTVVVGDNGAGKTNLLEAAGYLATLESFRGAPGEALVRQGQERAVVRGAADRGGRELPIHADVVGKKVEVGAGERVDVMVAELDERTEVVIVPKSAA